MTNRTDRTTALFIDAVIKMSVGRGTTEVACLLYGNAVPLEIAVRVLTRPQDRRCRAVAPSKIPPA